MRGRRRIVISAATLLVLVGGLFAATEARSRARAATWTWQESVPGDPAASTLRAAAASAGASSASVRELAVADGFALVAASENGALMIGPASGDQAQLAPLAQAVGDQPVAVYAAAAPEGAQQQLVGVTRSDVDRVEAVLADGSQKQLPLNQWRGFDYVAASASQAAVAVIAYSGGDSLGAVRLPQTTTQNDAARAAAQPLYGLFRTSLRNQTLTLAAVNARTLRPQARPKLQFRSQSVDFMALSPDDTELALVAAHVNINASPLSTRLVLVNLQSMKPIRTLPLTQGNTIRMLSWPQPDRLIELRQVMSQPYQRNVRSRSARIIDPATDKLVAEHPLTNKLAVRTAVTTPLGLVLLLGSSGLHGPNVQLDLVTPTGDLRTVTIPVGATKNVTHNNVLAVDRTTGHAYVVVAGGIVFDVDLSSMTVTRHIVTLLAGAPTTPAPISGLQARVFEGNLAAAALFWRANSNTIAPQGVYLIDTNTWTARVLDPTANFFTSLGNRLLTYGESVHATHGFPPRPVVGHGLSLYDESGKLISHLYGSRRFQDIELAPGYGYVFYNSASSVAVNPRTGGPSYFGPQDKLVFDLERGTALGSGKITIGSPPLGPPLLIYRGSPIVGES